MRILRRDFIAGFIGAVAAWPVVGRAQQSEGMRRMGVLMSLPESDPEAQLRLTAIRAELQKRGWSEASNIRLDVRWPGGQSASQSVLARELVELRPDILIGQSTPAVTALLRETRTIPIVFVQVVDPVGQGLVASLARPGGNITGFSNFELAIGGKWLELLKEIAPPLERVAVIFNPETAPYFGLYLRSMDIAGPSFSVQVTAYPIRNAADFEPALMLLGREPGNGLIFPPDTFTSYHRKLINNLAGRYRLPTVYAFPYIAADGGLLSYGPDVLELYRRAVWYVDRILRGEKPADLPVQQPTKFELVINLKTAKALGLEIPPTLLARANEVIE